MASQLLDFETNTSNFIARSEERISEMTTKINKMKDAEIMEAFVKLQVGLATERLEKYTDDAAKAIDDRIKKIVETHLESKD